MSHGIVLWLLLAISAAVLLAALGLLIRGLLYRVGGGAGGVKLKVHQRRDHANGWFTLVLRRASIFRCMPLPAFQGGHSISVSWGGNAVRRRYSLARWQAIPFEYEITIKPEPGGKLSQSLALHALPGVVLQVGRPTGDFVLTRGRGARRFVLIAGGVGITPLLAMLDQWCIGQGEHEPEVWLYWQTRTSSDWIYGEALARLASRAGNPQIRLLASRAQDGSAQRIGVPMLLSDLGNLSDAHFFLCAGQAMMDDLRASLQEAGVLESSIHFERFSAGSLASNAGRWSLDVDGSVLPFDGDASLLCALERAHVRIASDCRTGTCGQCAVRVISGQTQPLFSPEFLAKPGHVLACCSVPVSDMQLSVPRP